MAASPRAPQLRRFSPFSFLGSLTRRSRAGRGDIGPEPLVALHGMPQRETSAGPLSEVGLCVPRFAPTTLRGRLSRLPPLTFFSLTVDTLMRRSRVGWGDIGPEPLVALHGMPQRETSAGPLSEVGLCVPWFAPTTLRGRLSWSPPLTVVSFDSFFFSFSLFFSSSFLFFFASFFFFFVFLFLCLVLASGLHMSGRPSFPFLDTR